MTIVSFLEKNKLGEFTCVAGGLSTPINSSTSAEVHRESRSCIDMKVTYALASGAALVGTW